MALRVELASGRKLRDRNKPLYRLAHWPIWIFVFFIVPGPSTFQLFEHGFDRPRLIWLGLVILGTGIAALRGRLPGVEPRPYIIRFVEDNWLSGQRIGSGSYDTIANSIQSMMDFTKDGSKGKLVVDPTSGLVLTPASGQAK